MTTQAELEKMRDTVISDGWKLLMQDVQKQHDTIRDALGNPAGTIDEIRVAQGRLSVYRELLALPDVIDLTLKQREEDLADVEIDPV